MTRQYFGTDGVRGPVGELPITPGFFMRLGAAVGKVLAREGRCRVVLGKDTRLSGYMLESAMEAGLAAAGVDTWLLGPMPTPAIAYFTRTFHAGAGIVISASHNPYYDNGIKFFSSEGVKLPDDVECEIEALLEQELTVEKASKCGRAYRVEDAVGRYIEYCKATLRSFVDLSGLHVVVDAANGANYQVGPKVFRELGAKVDAIGVTPDGLNINRDVGSTHLDALKKEVLERGADLGIAFDGDGDRVLMVDHQGSEVDGDDILYIIARYQRDSHTLQGGVVGTVMSNLGAEQAFAAAGIPFVRTKVGDRHVHQALQDNAWQLGGEPSGHIVCRDLSTTGDGVVAALQVLRVVVETGTSLKDLACHVHKYPQKMINVKVLCPMRLDSNTVLLEAARQMEAEMAGHGRLLLRQSGTEPVVRVMVEGDSSVDVARRCQELADLVESESRRELAVS